MSVQSILAELTNKVNQSPEILAGMNTVFQFDISGDDQGTFQVKIQDNQAVFTNEAKEEPKATFVLSDKNFVKLVEGNLNPTTAFMMGKIKIKGDLSAAMKLQSLLKAYQGGGV
ncbi:SCP2 sterol-binding domain-containing protein [Caldalkalibacillus mannanilyticus]|uniref:SCP2 sterol-binding domain-containing protein n=1 Tax=Caldalkalibacillus mannanilyticus TaxID=1418 RepID=UPI00046B01C3|nr:SCP2 sterol-binding domain-containing protein [Caldalkalibacillus mannanilyticus]